MPSYPGIRSLTMQLLCILTALLVSIQASCQVKFKLVGTPPTEVVPIDLIPKSLVNLSANVDWRRPDVFAAITEKTVTLTKDEYNTLLGVYICFSNGQQCFYSTGTLLEPFRDGMLVEEELTSSTSGEGCTLL